jgi:hypothetical protein
MANSPQTSEGVRGLDWVGFLASAAIDVILVLLAVVVRPVLLETFEGFVLPVVTTIAVKPPWFTLGASVVVSVMLVHAWRHRGTARGRSALALTFVVGLAAMFTFFLGAYLPLVSSG